MSSDHSTSTEAAGGDLTTESSNAYGPSTSFDSQEVMLRAERCDTIIVTDVMRCDADIELPQSYDVVQRTETYFGPELMLEAAQCNYLLIAPGPDRQLDLYIDTSDHGEPRSWKRIAEITAEIDETPSYDLCPQCGNPLRSVYHERMAAIGRCPGAAD